MKVILMPLLLTVLASCHPAETKYGANQIDPAEGALAANDIPSNARRERMADDPEWELVTILDAQQNLLLEGRLLKGAKEGAWIEYNSNGAVKSVTPYRQGRKEGTYVEMTNTGQYSRRIGYHRDIRHGDYIEFVFPYKKEERHYINGQLEGMVKIYYSDGKIMEEGAYHNDTRDGLSKWYDTKGNVTIQYEYKNGELVKK